MEWTREYSLLSEAIAGENGSVEEAHELIPDIIRLVEDPDVKKEIYFDEISISDEEDTTFDPTLKSEKKDIAGAAFPVIRINDYVFPPRSIRNMEIQCTSFIPTISVSIKTIESNMLNKNMPKDGDMLSLYMRTTTAALEFVRCDFLITSVVSSSVSSLPTVVGTSISVFGKLFIPGFDATRMNVLGYIGTSRDVLRHVAEKFHIGFAYNEEENSNDLQNWISCNRTIPEFVNELISHSWKDNVSFYNAWIDIYYNLVYVNINKYLNSEKSNSEIDMTFLTNVISTMQGSQHNYDASNAIGALKIFTTFTYFRGTPFYIKKWWPTNNSTNISLGVGYSSKVCSFIHNQGVINEDVNNSFSMLESIPSYNKEKAKTEIILRGRSKYDPNQNPESDQETVNYDFTNTYVKKTWYGVLQMKNDDESDITSNDSWSGNVHKNYALAPMHNRINMAELNKMYITIECEGLNLQVQRGEYVPVFIGHKSTIDTIMNNNENRDIPNAELIGNRMYSGYYYVDSVKYIYKYGDSQSFSDFSTIFVLKRREWPTPEIIEPEVNNDEKLPEEEIDNEQMG